MKIKFKIKMTQTHKYVLDQKLVQLLTLLSQTVNYINEVHVIQAVLTGIIWTLILGILTTFFS